ncbi:MAG: hypothetical protein E7487_06285 [Ruminococcaceae bacterium]|nr:hypothetical protein [Oscillospiraceae bacterium]
MSSKSTRIISLFSLFILFFAFLVFRLAALSQGVGTKPASADHGSYTLNVINDRAYFYDCRFVPLVNNTPQYTAAVLPNPANSFLLESYYPPSAVMELLATRKPVLLPLPSDEIYAPGVQIYRGKKRYSDTQTAVHLIGSLTDAMTVGGSGLEKALDDYLTQNSTVISARYHTDALGRAFDNDIPETITDNPDDPAGVVLTLDLRVQSIAEKALKKLTCGAVVIMDIKNGDIKASASYPVFNPNNLSADMDSALSPFLNRAFASYCVGSTFKLVTAAAALEANIPTTFEHICTGSVTIGDVTFHCQNRTGHGSLMLKDALAFSCNPYFISLAAETGADRIYSLALLLGFGSQDTLWENFSTSPGNLPSAQTLATPAGAANFAFGQGELLATPIQLCKLVCTIANGGYSVTPRLIDGFTDDGVVLTQPAPLYSQNRILSEETANILKEYMINVVKNGSGRRAAPDFLSAGGKTASAQTGQYIDGEEKIEGWFAGFYPAEEPRFAITVLAEGAGSGAVTAAPVFKEIADGLYDLFYREKTDPIP